MMKTYINYFVKGILIGISFLVPGMSGGTMMVLLGVFDEAIRSINLLIKGNFHKFDLMVVMGVGCLIALVAFSPLILTLLKGNYALTVSFFFGIILTGVILLYQEINHKTIQWKDLVYIAIGIAVVMLLDTKGAQFLKLEGENNWVRFVTLVIVGIPIAVALILPGISTSFLLLSFGLYETVLGAIIAVDFAIIIPLTIGIIVGTLLLTGYLERQLIHNKRRLYMIIIGFIFGSIFEMVEQMPVITITEIPLMITLCLVGMAVMFALNKIKEMK